MRRRAVRRIRRKVARASILPCWMGGAFALLWAPYPLVLCAAAVAAVALLILVRP